MRTHGHLFCRQMVDLDFGDCRRFDPHQMYFAVCRTREGNTFVLHVQIYLRIHCHGFGE